MLVSRPIALLRGRTINNASGIMMRWQQKSARPGGTSTPGVAMLFPQQVIDLLTRALRSCASCFDAENKQEDPPRRGLRGLRGSACVL